LPWIVCGVLHAANRRDSPDPATGPFPIAREFETGIDPRYIVIVDNSTRIGNDSVAHLIARVALSQSKVDNQIDVIASD